MADSPFYDPLCEVAMVAIRYLRKQPGYGKVPAALINALRARWTGDEKSKPGGIHFAKSFPAVFKIRWSLSDGTAVPDMDVRNAQGLAGSHAAGGSGQGGGGEGTPGLGGELSPPPALSGGGGDSGGRSAAPAPASSDLGDIASQYADFGVLNVSQWMRSYARAQLGRELRVNDIVAKEIVLQPAAVEYRPRALPDDVLYEMWGKFLVRQLRSEGGQMSRACVEDAMARHALGHNLPLPPTGIGWILMSRRPQFQFVRAVWKRMNGHDVIVGACLSGDPRDPSSKTSVQLDFEDLHALAQGLPEPPPLPGAHPRQGDDTLAGDSGGVGGAHGPRQGPAMDVTGQRHGHTRGSGLRSSLGEKGGKGVGAQQGRGAPR